jgi:arginase family enzyme
LLLILGGLTQLPLDVLLPPSVPPLWPILGCMTQTGTSRLADGPIYHVLGVPYRTGSLTPGSEHDAQPYRDIGFVSQLQVAGCEATDSGNIALPSYLPHHEVPPIRNWPGPRIAWEILGDRLLPILDQPGHVPLLIGGDCSIVVGTTQALMKSAGLDQVHLLYVDGDCDDGTPDPTTSQSAAYLALWLTMHGHPFRAGAGLPPSQVTVIGATRDRQRGAAKDAPRLVSIAEIRREGAGAIAQRILDVLPSSASVVLHLDVDVFADHELPVAYFPHDDGLTLAEGRELLGPLLSDQRIRIIEITEYASLRDFARRHIKQIADLLAGALRRRG